MRTEQIKESVRIFSEEVTYAYSNLFFIRNRFVGLLLFAATLFNKNIAVLGLFSLLTALIFTRFIGIKNDDPVNRLISYNSLLTGFAAGFLFKITALSVLFACGMSIFTVLLTYTLSSALYLYFRLPVLNIPFTISAMIIYLASGKYSNLIVDSFYKQEYFNIEGIPAFIQGLLRAAGILIFMPYDIIGIILLTAVLIYSRITFFTAVLSYYAGIYFLALLKGSVPLAFLEVSSFNFILVGMSLGGMFLIPSKRTYLLTLSAVLTSVFVIDAASAFWVSFGIPVFTLPFNLTVLLYIYVLGSVKYVMMNNTNLEQPERSLDDHLNYKNRFDWTTPAINLPFFGKWTVYQSFDGDWTHKGLWRYAYDFVIKENGKTFKNEGKDKQDYLCYGKPVVSPVDGTVIEVYDEAEDNEIGEVDKINNWGNYIIIYFYPGYYVELSHLKKDSAKVKKNDQVSKGQLLAECGNSGYSPEPHLHVQVQYSHLIGSAGMEFVFNSFKVNDLNLDPRYLKKGDEVTALAPSKTLTRIMQFILDDEFKFSVFEDDIRTGELICEVKMETDGTYYFSDGKNNRLYFGNDKDRFVFFKYDGDQRSPLRYLFISLPSLPLSDDELIEWNEYIPENVWKRSFIPTVIKSFNHKFNKMCGFYTKKDRSIISGKIVLKGKVLCETTAELCDKKGFRKITIREGNKLIRLEKI
ncbi:MAG TPA: urea transporter [Clostridiales bacterium]|nr:urea transporter [Clostridiales bacterium]HQP70081.1 urea transporter [Clostridiales bacterium]